MGINKQVHERLTGIPSILFGVDGYVTILSIVSFRAVTMETTAHGKQLAALVATHASQVTVVAAPTQPATTVTFPKSPRLTRTSQLSIPSSAAHAFTSVPITITVSQLAPEENNDLGTFIALFLVEDSRAQALYTFTLGYGDGDDNNDSFLFHHNQLIAHPIVATNAERDFRIRVNGDERLWRLCIFSVGGNDKDRATGSPGSAMPEHDNFV
ncbi:MAG: hypothetical protein IPL78_28975 [Chloroflexi bacterium]|nr:hypothetical protein [Chloroflexota bacterium]